MKTIPLRHLVTVTNSNVDKVVDPDELPVRLCNYVDVYNNDRITNDLDYMLASATPAEIDKFSLQVGDVLITKDSEDRDDIAVPAYVAETASDLVCGYHLAILRARPEIVRGDFLFWAIQSKPVREAFSNAAEGITRFGLTLDGIKSVSLSCLDLETQKAIADFLDRETARIDQLIERKQRLLELVDEKRASLITAAVTGQIDPITGQPRPTSASDGGGGTLARLRYFVQIGPRPTIAHLLIEDAEVTFAPMEALADGLGGLDTSLTRPVSEVASGSYNFFEEGDLLLAKVTPCFENGKKALARKLKNGVGFATSEVHVIRPDTQQIDPMFLFYVLNSEEFKAAGIASMTGASGLRRVSEDGVLDFRLYIPDLETQRAIVDYLDRETGRMDPLKEKVTKSMELLREYRAALITAAVTGQIDVCGSHESGKHPHEHACTTGRAQGKGAATPPHRSACGDARLS